MAAYFKTKTIFFVSSVFYYWCIDAGIDLTLIKIVLINARLVIKDFADNFAKKTDEFFLKTERILM